MTTLQRVAKEDLVEGREYVYDSLSGNRLTGVVHSGGEYFVVWLSQMELSAMFGQFYGPIELES